MRPLLLLALSAVLATPSVRAQAPAYQRGTLLFQTDRPWSPRANVNGDTVMVYGIDQTLPDRVHSWQAHGYRVTVMTGVAWGRYGPYLRGDFDGHTHWDETQQQADGTLILHGARDIPYMSPTPAYERFLTEGVETALDAGAEAIYLEEPEFWARAGWSDSFRRSWQQIYHEPWQAPDSSPAAQYRASELKYRLYRDTLAQIFAAVKAYGAAHGRSIPCYVATHSLLNYAQWDIVSPEFSLLSAGTDGYVAQVWTGTARTPNLLDGKAQQRTFETAFLEYGALQNVARSSGKPIWYLNDPIEDNPNHSWADYRSNYQDTLVASLLQPEVSRYELVPWPERIFGEGKTYPTAEPSATDPHPARAPIPAGYATELQNVFHALGAMRQPPAEVHWRVAGTEGLGVLVSDTLMFERAQPDPSDPYLSQIYGLAMPPLMAGMPIEPVQMEGAAGPGGASALGRYRLLLLTYDGQKAPSPQFHTALAAWVRGGGALVVFDDDRDPYNDAKGWWNTAGRHDATPRLDLFRQLGLDPAAAGLHRVGDGAVLYVAESPATLAHAANGSGELMRSIGTAAAAVHLPLVRTGALVLQRGPYVIAGGLDAEGAPAAPVAPTVLQGSFVDLFNPELPIRHTVEIGPGTRDLLLDLQAVRASSPSVPTVLAAAGRLTQQQASAHTLRLRIAGIEGTAATLRVLLPRPLVSVQLDGQPLAPSTWTQAEGTALLHFTNAASGHELVLQTR